MIINFVPFVVFLVWTKENFVTPNTSPHFGVNAWPIR